MDEQTNDIPSSWLQVDLGRLRSNYRVIADLVEPSGSIVCPVVKANAYGLGARSIATVLAEAGAGMLAVYSAEQAASLVDLPITTPIMILSPIRSIPDGSPLATLADADRLHLTVHDLQQLAVLEASDWSLPVHLHIDTGMTRSGIALNQLNALYEAITNTKKIQIAGIYTHFATADDDPAFVSEQLKRFDDALVSPALPDDVLVHVANTDGTLRDAVNHRRMVRVGLAMYGYSHFELAAGLESKLEPVVKWCSRLNQVNDYLAGETVGYARTHRLTRDSRLGVIPVGYADGYSFALGNKANVVLPRLSRDGQFTAAPVLGRVSMDQIIVDLTDLTSSHPDIEVGELVELYSDDPRSPCAVPRLAEITGTHCYEMLTRLGGHLARRYVE